MYLTLLLPPRAPPTTLLALCSHVLPALPFCSRPSSFLEPCAHARRTLVQLPRQQLEGKQQQHLPIQ